MTLDALSLFDAATVAAIQRQHQAAQQVQGQARAVRRQSRKQVRQAKSEAHLAAILPAVLDDGDSWHVLSRGDVDALSYVAHVLSGMGYADELLLSTWCMASADLKRIAAWLDAGTVDRLTLCAGEIFPSQYPDEYRLALEIAATYDNARLIVARNHSKVSLLARHDWDNGAGYFVAIESSANVNTNPRIEQTALHRDRVLHDFYREQFCALKSIARTDPVSPGARAKRQPAGNPPAHQARHPHP